MIDLFDIVKKQKQRKYAVHSAVPKEHRGRSSRALKRKIMKYMPRGKKNAIKLDELAKLCGLEWTRNNSTLRKNTKELFKIHNIPIIGSRKGVYIAKSIKEINEQIEKERKIIKAAQGTIEVCIKAKQKMKRKENNGY